LLPVIVAVLVVLAPDGLVTRLNSTFNAQDPANVDRFAMLEIGARIRARSSAGRHRAEHDPACVCAVPVRITREQDQSAPAQRPDADCRRTGTPRAAVWFWFIGALTVASFKIFRRPPRTSRERVLAATALASIVAMFVAGLFEYNFGDSEFLMLFPGPDHAAVRGGPTRRC
jgi:hypothetical protein